MNEFENLGVKAQFIKALNDLNIVSPTEIQEKAIKPILAGQEIIATAPTGSGKTIAFMLPVMQLLKGTKPQTPRVLVLAPTKELALQIESMTEALNTHSDLKVVGIIGGVAKQGQRERLKQGVDIVVATPGRFLELYLEGLIPLKKIEFLVLDEADRLMEMGFLNQLNNILEVIPRKAKKLLFSATFPQKVEEIVDNFVAFPHRIAVSKQEMPAEGITQYKVALKNRLTKLAFLEQLLLDPSCERVMVFTRTKEIATQTYKYVERKLEKQVGLLHANKGQNTRSNTFEAFKNGDLRVLITTDVSARGVDIPLVSHVINFDVPLVKQEYVHRVGRTGRAGNKGVAMTFFTEVEEFQMDILEEYMGNEIKLLDPKIEARDFLPGEEKATVKLMDLHRQNTDPDYRGAFSKKKKIFPPKKLKKKH